MGPPIDVQRAVSPQSMAIYRLSTIVSDLLSDPNHKVSGEEVDKLFDELGEEGLVDEFYIKWLAREFRLAIDTHDRKIIALVGHSLKEVRKRFIEGLKEEKTL